MATMLHERMLESAVEPIPLKPLTPYTSSDYSPHALRGPPPDSSRLSRIIGPICLGISATVGVMCIAGGIYIAEADWGVYNVVLPPTWPGGPPKYNVLPGTVTLLPDLTHRLVLPELLRPC
jgi:hypothetical protein